MTTDPLERLNAAMSDVSDVYIVHRANAEAYLTELKKSLHAAICVPFDISAVVMEPGFEYASVGSIISGQCVAHAGGYWLVYQPNKTSFCAFGVLSLANSALRVSLVRLLVVGQHDAAL